MAVYKPTIVDCNSLVVGLPRQSYCSKTFYLAIVILDLVLGISGLLFISYLFGLDVSLWLTVSILCVCIGFLATFQYFGWKGFLDEDRKCVQLFTTYRLVIAFCCLFNLLKTQDNTVFLIQLSVFLLSVVMVYIPAKFAEELNDK